MKEKCGISNKVKIAKPSTMEIVIASDKTGKTLQANEEIQYKVALRNNGEAKANVNISVAQMLGISIQKIETINLSTGVTTSVTTTDLEKALETISINPNEIVQINILGRAKSLELDTTNTMYVNITGENIE